MDIHGYLAEIRALYASGSSTEHSFRPALAKLFGSIDPALTVINEPKHLTDVGAPDFVFNRGSVAIGWCEAKDIGKNVRKFAATDYSKAQKERYKKGLPNLIYTNGLDFEFIRDGGVVDFITVADLIPTLPARAENFPMLENRLRDFAQVTPLSITSSAKLAAMMAGKAAIIKDIMARALVADMKDKDATGTATDLIGQYEAFKTSLIHDITVDEFADIYAETIAYGLFAARLHDETPDTFTRAEALDLLPKTNPFLRELFIYIAGPNLDERLRRVIDELCHVFCATNMDRVLRNFGKITARQDPFLHFYEDFLAEYNPAKRKARGVWYTPEPVVNFIVRAVDEVLKTEFGLADGLADTSKITIDWDTGQNHPKTGKPAHIKKEVHRVQILDPATGTGTFLAEVVKLVSERIKGIAPGQLSTYIERDLIPRLHGFELLMASYAMCHMKLDMILTRLGYKPSLHPPRLGVYLTNSLEEGERVEQTLFGLSRAIANEAKAASDIKRQTPIMCVIGNPPYSGESANKGGWIMDLMEAYKKEPGGKQKLQERNPKWINKDEHKFIRLAENMIVKNGEGILGFITSHGYLADPTLRGMRWHLMNSFDTIHVLDLHGNSNKKEICPNGSPDKNVFDIMQGVAIIVAVKHRRASKTPKPLAEVRHGDLWGSREAKNNGLWEGSIRYLAGNLLAQKGPQYPFVARDYALQDEYLKGFSIADLMPVNSNGIVTARDELTIDANRDALWMRVQDFTQTDAETLRTRYALGKDVQDWSVARAKVDVAANLDPSHVVRLVYRPFDTRWTFYTGTSRGFHCRPRNEVMRHYFKCSNIGLLASKGVKDQSYHHIFVTETISEAIFLSGTTASNAMNLPLYLYPAEGTLDKSIRVNFDPKLYATIRNAAGLPDPINGFVGGRVLTGSFRHLNHTGDARAQEVKVFDYIYGALHSPAYRARYAEFLKIDFPRIPFPANPESFRAISEQGEVLRRLHLMEVPAIGATPYPFHGDGGSVVDKPHHKNGRVWINADQYFDGVPAVAWEFHIGGYQPAQKWLKDRKGRALTYDDVRHYQRIIKILVETDRIMRIIDLPL
ncbi:DNA methyltransferase [Sphingomonas aurantiaca]|uniref:site-specific DNA-methyltransferase (adenine-specific) n=1 Tax=Sphingomonas aurantiaca TaxID=185949 RepID=A0A5E7Z008_9SPHN|nr:type ISP restriction/modification enzyme [Sphingomonas aurantiaca]VVT10043.1 DNA methyltransferase [Sphingomonas aurantiaca]